MQDKTDNPATKKYYDHVSIAKRTKQVAYLVAQHDKTALFEQWLNNNAKKIIY